MNANTSWLKDEELHSIWHFAGYTCLNVVAGGFKYVLGEAMFGVWNHLTSDCVSVD